MITRAKNQLRHLLPKNAFARGVSVLVGGTASAQLLLVLAAPLLTRLYSPEDFGLLAVYASLLALIGVVSSLRYELAIPLPEDDGEAANIAALSLILVGASTVLTGILVVLLGPAIADALGVPALAPYLWLLPVGVLIGGAYTVFNYWAVRTKRFTNIAGTKLRQAFATIAIQLAAFKLGGIALLFGQVAGQGVGTASLGRPALASEGFKQVTWGGISCAAGRYRRFPIFSTWGGFINAAGGKLPIFYLSSLFSPTLAGLYLLTERVIFGPSGILQNAVSQVLFSRAQERLDVDRYSKLTGDVHKNLLLISMPFAAFIFLYSPYIFHHIFGENWLEAGRYASALSLMFAFQFVSSPLTVIFHSINRSDYTLYYNAILFILRVLALIIGYLFFDSPLSAIILFSVFSSVGYLVFSSGTTRAGGLSSKDFIHNHFSALIYTALIFSIPLAILILFNKTLLSLAISLIAILFHLFYLFGAFKANE